MTSKSCKIFLNSSANLVKCFCRRSYKWNVKPLKTRPINTSKCRARTSTAPQQQNPVRLMEIFRNSLEILMFGQVSAQPLGMDGNLGNFCQKKLGQKVKINMREAFGWGWSSSSSENKSPFPWCSWFSWQEVFKVKPHPEKAPWAVRTSKFLSGILPGASSLLCKAPSSRPTTKAEGSASNKKQFFLTKCCTHLKSSHLHFLK